MANESNKELTSVWTPANIVTCVRIVFIPVFMILSALSHTSVAGTDWSTFDGPLAAAAFILHDRITYRMKAAAASGPSKVLQSVPATLV